ncbi:unnamed protein product [Aphanomyces euteiches]|nr:hypothetical protein Ae201684P_012202 [Aphanomyces euteiches]
MDLESQYERYDLSLPRVRKTNLTRWTTPTSSRSQPSFQVSAVQQRLKKMLQRGSALEDLVAMALVLLRHMHAYDMSEQSWTEYKSFVRQEDARFNAASQAAGRA